MRWASDSPPSSVAAEGNRADAVLGVALRTLARLGRSRLKHEPRTPASAIRKDPLVHEEPAHQDDPTRAAWSRGDTSFQLYARNQESGIESGERGSGIRKSGNQPREHEGHEDTRGLVGSASIAAQFERGASNRKPKRQAPRGAQQRRVAGGGGGASMVSAITADGREASRPSEKTRPTSWRVPPSGDCAGFERAIGEPRHGSAQAGSRNSKRAALRGSEDGTGVPSIGDTRTRMDRRRMSVRTICESSSRRAAPR